MGFKMPQKNEPMYFVIMYLVLSSRSKYKTPN